MEHWRGRGRRSVPMVRYGVSALALILAGGAPAFAASGDAATLEQLDKQIKILQQQVQDLKASQASKYAEQKSLPKLTLDNGRPTFKTADGKYSASLRALVQFDGGYYMQDDAPASGTGADLSSGTNFRRARIGITGTIAKVFDYNFIYDFGGSGSEKSAISSAYLQYNGLKPFKIRVGAFSPSASLEDSEGATDPLFMEKASAVEIARGIAGADGRSAIALMAAGERYYGSIAYTGARVGQTGFFDEQQGLVGRLAGLAFDDGDGKLLVGGNGSYVFDTADASAGPGASSTGVNFQNVPELRVDDTSSSNASASLVSTGNINADSVTQWGLDGAAQWKSLYVEGGYFKFEADRRGSGLAGSNPNFDGWYAEASWVLTGEKRSYDTKSAVFRAPKVESPFTGQKGTGWGALELAVRYSTIDLNYHEDMSTANGGIRGGEQDIWTIGVNWYANNAIRLSANYLFIDIDRLSGASAPFTDVGQDIQAVGFRTQVAF